MDPRPTGNPRVCAVTLTWNNYAYTAAAIRSMQRSAYPFSRIIVVDNGSTDGSVDHLEADFTDPQVQFIRNPGNEGFARGMNIGFREAVAQGAEMIYCVNNDTETDPACAGLLVEALRRDPRAGVAGPTIYYHGQPRKIWQAGGDMRRLRAGVVVPLKGKTADDVPARPTTVTFLTGCAFLFHADLLTRVGYLDPAYFFYGEDVDFGLRVAAAGLTMLYVPAASVWHKIEDVAKDRTSPFVLYHLGRGTALVFRKRFAPPYRWYAFLVQLTLYTPYRAWQIIKGGAGPGALRAWLRGLADGMRGREPRPV
jgi:GT2 family glycosyltransferase